MSLVQSHTPLGFLLNILADRMYAPFNTQGRNSPFEVRCRGSSCLDHPTSVAVDSAGNLFIADVSAYRVRKVSANGIITALAGSRRGETTNHL